MATFRDWPGLWQTLKDLRKQIARHGLQKLVRILVVDNEPDGPDGVHNAKLCTDAGARYIAMPDPVGTAPPRNRAIAESETPWTLVMDSHVDLMDDVLPQLITWCDGNQSPDLYYGPLLRFKLYEDDGTPAINWTHWKPEYGLDGMFGRTAIDARWKDPSGAPFEIPLAGSGLFLTRTASWLKWSPELRHFGVEGYIARKYRAAGRKLYCLPFLQWVHRFRPKSQTAPYPTDFLSRCRNEIVSHVEFSDPPLDQIRATFLDRARVSPTQWAKLLKEFKLKDPPKCPHKGKLLRVDPCELCGLKDQQAPVHHCSKHNVDCSPTRYQDIKAGRTLTRDCAGCHARNEDT